MQNTIYSLTHTHETWHHIISYHIILLERIHIYKEWLLPFLHWTAIFHVFFLPVVSLSSHTHTLSFILSFVWRLISPNITSSFGWKHMHTQKFTYPQFYLSKMFGTNQYVSHPKFITHALLQFQTNKNPGWIKNKKNWIDYKLFPTNFKKEKEKYNNSKRQSCKTIITLGKKHQNLNFAKLYFDLEKLRPVICSDSYSMWFMRPLAALQKQIAHIIFLIIFFFSFAPPEPQNISNIPENWEKSHVPV